jgi:hypothetical protein
MKRRLKLAMFPAAAVLLIAGLILISQGNSLGPFLVDAGAVLALNAVCTL